MSDFVFLYRAAPDARQVSPEEAQRRMQSWMQWMKGLADAGHIKSAGQPLGEAGKVVREQGQTITDGPYAEAKDIVLGFTVLEARDLQQAAELARGCPMLEGDGAVEVRPVLIL